jgi:hypothetical protein
MRTIDPDVLDSRVRWDGRAKTSCVSTSHGPAEAVYDRLVALLREGLPADELARLTAEGATLVPEAVTALALEDP